MTRWTAPKPNTEATPGWRARLLRRIPYLGSYVSELHRRHQTLGWEVETLRQLIVTVAESSVTSAGEVLQRARRDVSALTDSEEYRGLYRSEELLYWLHIPEWFGEWATDRQVRRVLDIGSGYGTLAVFAAMLTGAEVYCLDTSAQLISERLRAKHRLAVTGGNVEQTAIPWPGPMDAVVMTEVIEHFNFHPVPTMRKVAAVIAPGGRLFLSTPDAASWGRVPNGFASYRDMPPPDPTAPTSDMHIYQFSEEELRAVLTDSGFVIRRLERAPGRWGFHLVVEAEVSR